MVGRSSIVSWSGFFCTIFIEIAGSFTEFCGRKYSDDEIQEVGLLLRHSMEVSVADTGVSMSGTSI